MAVQSARWVVVAAVAVSAVVVAVAVVTAVVAVAVALQTKALEVQFSPGLLLCLGSYA